MSETRKLAAILVSEVVGYSRLAGAEEEQVLARLRALRDDLISPSHILYDKVCAETISDTDDMADIERLTITLPADMAAVVKGAVAEGDYASASEVVREALRDWKVKRALRIEELASLKADIDQGLADLAAGRVKKFDPKAIVARGRKLLAARSASA
jgi:antitoxin ParD1/3/4